MYYSYGNYEAFARPKKPENVENKSAYLIGSGLSFTCCSLFFNKGWSDGRFEDSYFRRVT